MTQDVLRPSSTHSAIGDARVFIVATDDDAAAELRQRAESAGIAVGFERLASIEELQAAEFHISDVAIVASLAGMTAIETLRAVRRRQRELSCIVIFDSITEALGIAAMEAGARDFVVRPTLERLAFIVRREIADGKVRSDRAGALRALQQNEERFRTMFEQAAVGMAEADENGRFVAVNDRLCEMLGYTEDELLRRSYLDITHPDDVEISRIRTERVAAGEVLHGMLDKRYLRKDGTAQWLSTDVSMVPDPVYGRRFLGFMIDIGGRRAAEEALRAGEARYRLILDQASDGIFFADASLRYVEVNRRACEMTGYSREELLSMKISDLIAPEDIAANPIRVANLQPGMSVLLERKMVTKSGRVVEIEVGATALADGSSIATVRDITERKRVAEALRLNEERLRAMVENGLDVISIVSPDRTVIYKSPSEKTVFGYEPEELIGTNGLDRIHPDDVPRVKRVFDDGLREPGATRRAEYRYLHKNGTWRDVEAVGSNLISHPAVRGIVITTRDITERNRIAAQLERAERLAGLGRLAATVAHEFNNVMMGIQPFAEVIRRVAPDEPKLQTAADQIMRSIARGKRITQDILRFTQPAQPSLATMPVVKWLWEVSSELAGMIAPKCELVIEAAGEDISITADATQMMQVVSNIVLNARDAMQSGGKITMRAGASPGGIVYPFGVLPDSGEFAHISITDTGCGMSRDTLERIWEPLFTTKKSGTGLGLPVARHIIERHNGRVFVESTPGAGTTFHIFLPRTDQQAQPNGVLRTDRNRRRVLVVDDEPAVAHGIEMLLLTSGHEVRCASSGSDALVAVRSFDPDVVLLDIALPDMNGVDVCRKLLQENPALPVIFSTAHGDPRTLRDLPKDAAIAFLQKPYEFEGLSAAMERVLAVGV